MATNNNDNFDGKTVILVDDGIATGATILSAAQWLEVKQNSCKMLIVAVPVTPPPRTPSNESIASILAWIQYYSIDRVTTRILFNTS